MDGLNYHFVHYKESSLQFRHLTDKPEIAEQQFKTEYYEQMNQYYS